MTPTQAIGLVAGGNLVDCTGEEYTLIRGALQNQAAKWIDQGQTAHAWVALNEVKRLDRLLLYSSQEVPA